MTSPTTLLSGALHSLLVGKPHTPMYPSTKTPSPLARLLMVSLCGFQLLVYALSAIGGVMLWAVARWYGWHDPLQDSRLLSLILEGSCVIGLVIGMLILLISRRWALSPGVEWGWMGIRLSLLVFLVLFGSEMVGWLEEDLTISFITGVSLIIPAQLFWQLGSTTIRTVLAFTPEDFQVHQQHRLLGKNQIFVSYRRADSKVWSDRIADELKAYFGSQAVFQDVEGIPPGVDFRQHLYAQLDQCQVLLLVIGPGWLTIKDEYENLRLDQPGDIVRLEIEVAMQRKIPIIPLLIDNATMPSSEKLPKSIQELAFQNVLLIRGNPDFRHDMKRLVEAVKRYVQ